jgi:sterol desaturase/sphingolipid hydroxylase (fatty acid hydroxylase superfamily)
MPLDSLRGLIFFAGLLIFSGVETLVPARIWVVSRWRRFLFHGVIAVMNAAFVRLVVFAPLMAWLVFVQSRGWGLFGTFKLSYFVEMGIGIVLLDLFDYWWHRWNHQYSFLWKFHQVHHADTAIDTSTSLRFHPGELFYSGFMEAIWILLLGPSASTYIVFKISITLAAQFHHSNIDFGDLFERTFGRVIVTPRFHAHHHILELSRPPGANFSTIFTFWDRIFRSRDAPKDSTRAHYGIPNSEGRDLAWRPAVLARY